MSKLKIDDKKQRLMQENALGNDTSLIENSEGSRYWYSIADGMRLLLWIRKEHLNYQDLENFKENYDFFEENNNRILITEPYYHSNFEDSFASDISRITATNRFEGYQDWQFMPQTIISTYIKRNALVLYKNFYRL